MSLDTQVQKSDLHRYASIGALFSTRNEGRARSNAINREIKEESRSSKRVNMLLLGTDPEKSAVVKQMSIQHGLITDQLLRYRLTVYRNCLDSAQVLVHAIRSMGIEYTDPMNRVKADLILDYRIPHTLSFIFSPDITEAIHQLWQDPVMPKVMDRRHEFWLSDGAEYFFNEILRIGSPDYLPTNNDILRTHEKLSQVTETCLTFGALQLAVIDVGRQHTPKKWLPYFENVNYIMFCASLSDYDKVMQVDDGQSELDASLVVFESIVQPPRFMHPTIILFLTNFDEFKHKLSKVPLETYFPDYTGGANVSQAMEYIRSRFTQTNRAGLPLYFIQHQATSPNLRSISEIVKRTILQDAWKDLRKKPSRSAAMQVLRLQRMFSPTDPQESHM